MKVIFDKIIWDVNDLVEIFSVARVKRFLKKEYAIEGNSVAYDLEEMRSQLGDGDLITEAFEFFYPNKLILVDDLYKICLQISDSNRPSFSRFVPYKVRVIAETKGNKRQKTKLGIRLKGKKVGFVGGFGKYKDAQIPKIMKAVGAQKTSIPQADLLIVASFTPTAKDKEAGRKIYATETQLKKQNLRNTLPRRTL